MLLVCLASGLLALFPFAGTAHGDDITSLVTARIAAKHGSYLSYSTDPGAAHFSPDGRYLFTYVRGPTPAQILLVPNLKSVIAFAGSPTTTQPPPIYHPDMRRAVTTVYGSENNVTKLWKLPGWKPQAVLNDVYGEKVSPDWRFLAARAGARPGLWTLADGKFLTQVPPPEKNVKRKGRKGFRSRTLAFSPSAPLLAVEEDMTDDELKLNPELERLAVDYRKVSKDNRYVPSRITLWSVPAAKLVATLPGAHGFIGFDLAGNLWCYGPKGGAHVYALPEGKLVASFGDDEVAISRNPAYAQVPYLAVLSPDGRHLAYANDRNTRLWSVAGRKLLATIASRAGGRGFNMSFSPDGRLLATSNDPENKCRLWSVPSGKLLATLSENDVGLVAFSPDNRILAANGRDGKRGGVALWLYEPGDKLDWSLAKGTGAKPEVTLSSRKNTYVGDELQLDLVLRNTGKGDLTQLWAAASGDAPLLIRLGCVLGRVKAGEKVQRRMSILLPTDHPTGKIKGSLSLHQTTVSGTTTTAHPFVIEIKPLPRPDFALTAKPAELRLRRGQKLDVPVVVSNQIGEAVKDLRVTLSVLKSDERVTLVPAALDLGAVGNNTKAERVVTLQAKKDAAPGPVTFELRAVDGEGRVFAVQRFALPIKE